MSEAEETKSVHRHRQSAPRNLVAAVITVSDTRTLETDTGGALLVELLEKAGHRIALRRLVPDDAQAIRARAGEALSHPEVQAVLLTGGTGVAPRDVTPEALAPLLERELPGFGELFRMLSFEEIGPAAMLSRAVAGMVGDKVVFALPGSRGALRTAMTRLILPELGHLVGEGGKRGPA
ncbi:MAG: molybdenum cofactor biosynthesis protein [Deltaproteobacteria bacterium]|jgi:molybdenum cofactor biosynthesis protein B|nr:molybdenum cofactor biosynthesis protein [Deltaproteobacteria bacterium]